MVVFPFLGSSDLFDTFLRIKFISLMDEMWADSLLAHSDIYVYSFILYGGNDVFEKDDGRWNKRFV
jgi:hypothetical protein